MRFRIHAALMIVSLAISPLHSAAADQKLSSDFVKPAGDYLAALRDCSARSLAEDGSTCNDNNHDIDKQTKSAASTAGDNAVYKILTDWDDWRAFYNLDAHSHPPKAVADFKHLVE